MATMFGSQLFVTLVISPRSSKPLALSYGFLHLKVCHNPWVISASKKWATQHLACQVFDLVIVNKNFHSTSSPGHKLDLDITFPFQNY